MNSKRKGKRNIILLGIITLTALLPSMSLAAEETWTKKADMPTARVGPSTCVVDGKIYAIGGAESPEVNLSTVEEYDPATDTWTKKADMPTVRCCAADSVVNGKIYVIGGSTGLGITTSTVEEYDPATDTWTTKADMPTARKGPGTSVVDGKIYAIGGSTGAEAPPVDPTGFILSNAEEYHPATDTWTTRADMPTARTFVSTSVVNGKIYAIGGDVAFWPWSPTSAVEEYPVPEWPLAGSWISIIPIPGLGDIIGEWTVSPQDLDGTNFTCVMRPGKPEATVFGSFPDADHQSDHIGQTVKTGLNTYESTMVGYGTKKSDLPGMLPEIIYISVIYSKAQLIDENTMEGEGTHAFFLPSADADGDGLPDEGQEPIACFPFMVTSKRVQLMPPCVPPPPEPEGE